MFYSCDGESSTEYDFVIWIEGSNTGVLMGSTVGKSEAEEAFSSLSFSIE